MIYDNNGNILTIDWLSVRYYSWSNFFLITKVIITSATWLLEYLSECKCLVTWTSNKERIESFNQI